HIDQSSSPLKSLKNVAYPPYPSSADFSLSGHQAPLKDIRRKTVSPVWGRRTPRSALGQCQYVNQCSEIIQNILSNSPIVDRHRVGMFWDLPDQPWQVPKSG